MKLFRCKHPLRNLAINRPETRKKIDEEFMETSYYFICLRCGSDITVKYATFLEGAKKFLETKHP